MTAAVQKQLHTQGTKDALREGNAKTGIEFGTTQNDTTPTD